MVGFLWGLIFQSVSSRNSLDFPSARVLVLLGTCWAMRYMSLNMHQSQSSSVSSIVQVPCSGFLPGGRCMRQLLSCPCSDWLLFGAGSFATLELVIFWTIYRSFSHRWKTHPNSFWMRWWRLLCLAMVALSHFRLLDVSSLTTILFLSWLLHACSHTCICFYANPGLVVLEVAENEEGLSTPLVDETLAPTVAELACGEIHLLP